MNGLPPEHTANPRSEAGLTLETGFFTRRMRPCVQPLGSGERRCSPARYLWATYIARNHATSTLPCPQCGTEMRALPS